jgi:putative ABC transport system substrate-binding protein
MIQKIVVCVLCMFCLPAVSLVEAQQPAKKVFRIGLLSGNRSSPMPLNVEAFRQGLRELGYVEGQNTSVEYRFAEGKDERYPILAAELVNFGVDAIVTAGTGATLAAKHNSYRRRQRRRSGR